MTQRIVRIDDNEYILDYTDILSEEQIQLTIDQIRSQTQQSMGQPCSSCSDNNVKTLATCPTVAKNVGDSLRLSASGSSGTAPYKIEFKRNDVVLWTDVNVADSVIKIYDYRLVSADAPSVKLSTTVTDSCAATPKVCEQFCNVSVGSVTNSIIVTNPTAGTIMTFGEPRVVRWTWTGTFANVKIELLKGGVLVNTIISNTPNDGSFAYTVPTVTAGSNYTIKVTDIANSATTGSSGNFTIQDVITTGSIDCSTTPSGAQVWVDNVNQNLNTPILLTNVSAGSHSVVFKLTGYDNCTRPVDVTAGATSSVSCVLTSTCVPNWVCRIPLDGYEHDANNCPGSVDRLASRCNPIVPKYRCSSGSCIRDDTNGTYTDSNCNGDCTVVIPKYKCQSGSCVRDDVNGIYLTSDCGGACVPIPSKYNCNNGVCSGPFETGTYDSLAACQAACTVVIPKYKCSGGACVRDDVNGIYLTSDCGGACAPIPKYKCSNGSCVRDDVNGTYATSDCGGACVAPPKSNIWIYLLGIAGLAGAGYYVYSKKKSGEGAYPVYQPEHRPVEKPEEAEVPEIKQPEEQYKIVEPAKAPEGGPVYVEPDYVAPVEAPAPVKAKRTRKPKAPVM